MIETNLPCGQLFTFTVIAQDDRCDSPTSLPEKYMTSMCLIYIALCMIISIMRND